MNSPRAPRILVLTGAGVSAESGLGTFRDRDGVWAKFDPYALATPEGFATDPVQVHAFYNMRRRDLLTTQPNAAHHALATLEQRLAAAGGALTVVTQNIDDLHERAGSRTVVHMHGELRKARCDGVAAAGRGDDGCGAISPWDGDLSLETACPACGLIGVMRPHVVWFNEIPLYLDDIADALDRIDVFVAIGTSGAVWPAAGFVLEAKARGARTLELNLEPSDGAAAFDDARYGPATTVVPAWVEEISATVG